jgi:hypothetical protein
MTRHIIVLALFGLRWEFLALADRVECSGLERNRSNGVSATDGISLGLATLLDANLRRDASGERAVHHGAAAIRVGGCGW